jgi:hypothetical protein
VLGLFAASAVFSAIASYARAMVYRYATGRPVPGIPAAAFAGVFTPRRGRRRWPARTAAYTGSSSSRGV